MLELNQAISNFFEAVGPSKEKLFSQLEDYKQYQDGWDGEGSFGPTNTVLGSAYIAIQNLPTGIPLPSLMLSPSGSIGLYWDIGSAYCDVEFSTEGKITVFTFINRKETFQEIALCSHDFPEY